MQWVYKIRGFKRGQWEIVGSRVILLYVRMLDLYRTIHRQRTIQCRRAKNIPPGNTWQYRRNTCTNMAVGRSTGTPQHIVQWTHKKTHTQKTHYACRAEKEDRQKQIDRRPRRKTGRVVAAYIRTYIQQQYEYITWLFSRKKAKGGAISASYRLRETDPPPPSDHSRLESPTRPGQNKARRTGEGRGGHSNGTKMPSTG